jgi:RNA polymerase sigma-70 factor (ECF subfamily)
MGMTGTGERDEELFRRLYPELRRFARVVRPIGMDADDLVQEAVARTLARRSLTSLEEPAAYLRSAMVRVAMNASRSWNRARARHARVADRESVSDVYASDVDELMHVPVRARAVLFLTVVEGQSYREAATALGCSEAAARKLASRATKDLRTELSREALA